MSRALCKQCQRPTVACICNFICNIDNPTAVLVLQHPSEVKQTKGTVALLSRSLNQCKVLVGEDFTDNDELNYMLDNYQALLLYPSKESKVLSSAHIEQNSVNTVHEHKVYQPKLLIILDGTWKKAYRMLMLSSNLQALKQVCLPDSLANRGQYLIRKVAKKNALSSLEACCFALALLEGEIRDNALSCREVENTQSTENTLYNNEKDMDYGLYQGLLNKFAQFNQFQLSFRPSI